MPTTLSRPVGAVGLGDHLCLSYTSDAEQHDVTTTYVRHGLDNQEKVFYFADTVTAVLGFLDAGGVAVGPAIEKGQLVMLASEDSYLADGPFDPDAMITRLHDAITGSLTEGYAGMRVTGETNWMLREGISPQVIAAYEQMATGVFDVRPACGLCQYDQRKFPAAELAAAQAAHSLDAVPDPLHQDALMTLTPTYAPAGLRVAGEVDMANTPAWQAALTIAVARSDQDVHLDLSVLSFTDVDGVRALVLTAADMPGGRRLVLDAAPPELVTMLTLTGWDRTPNLVINGG